MDSLPNGGTTFTNHLKGYQNLLLDAKAGKWTFNTFLQTEEDVMNKVGRGFAYRFYNLYVKGTDLFDFMDFKLGRQYISAGAGRGTVDGAYIKMKFGKDKEYQLIGYGGELTPLDYDFQKYSAINKNYTLGGQFLYYGVKDLSLGLSYFSKNRKPDSYYAMRADSLYNTTQILVETDSRADQQAGFDFNYTYNRIHNFYGKAYYDIRSKRLTRGEFNFNTALTKTLRVSGGYLYREPQISYNTIFWVFTNKANQEVQLGFDNMFCNNINVYARLASVLYENDHSIRLTAGVSHPAYGISYSKYFGYAGESDGFSGYLSHELVKSKLALTGSLNYSTYYLGDYGTDRINTLGGLLGFTYRPMPRLSVDLQGQMMTNRIYKYDTRFLIGFNYWLFSKL